MYALCSDAMLKAITRQARAVDEKVSLINADRTSKNQPPITIAYFFDHLASDEDTAVMVREEDFVEAHRELVPSVSADELGHYERVRKTFEGTGKKESPNSETPVDRKGKGKAVAPLEGADVDGLIIQTENADINSSSGKGKGKGKAPVSHASKNSIDIAEGGFGGAADGDEELYS